MLPDNARALAWEYDIQGKLLSAKTKDGSSNVINDVIYQYDAYNSTQKAYESHNGEVDIQTSYHTDYSFEGPDNTTYGHNISHRLTGYTTHGSGGTNTINMSYGDGSSISNMLGRVEKHAWVHKDWEDNNMDYFCEEKFVGTNRWQQSDYYRDYDESPYVDPEHSLTQKVTTKNQFGQPTGYLCEQVHDPLGSERTKLNFPRSYDYTNYHRLSCMEDNIEEENWSGGLDRTRTYGYNSFGEIDSFNHSGPSFEPRVWGYDATGNWIKYSEDIDDYPQDPADYTRCYDRNNEIKLIGDEPGCEGEPDEKVKYDKAGRIIRHHHHAVASDFEYDAWGRLVLVKAVSTGNTQSTYTYNAMGNLISKDDSNNSYNFYYGGKSKVLWHENTTTYSTTHYVRSNESGRLIAKDEPNHECFWYILDAMNEIAGICAFESSGSFIQLYYYSPSGELVETVDNGSGNYNNIIYGGEFYNSEALWEYFMTSSLNTQGNNIHQFLTAEAEEVPESPDYPEPSDEEINKLYRLLTGEPERWKVVIYSDYYTMRNRQYQGYKSDEDLLANMMMERKAKSEKFDLRYPVKAEDNDLYRKINELYDRVMLWNSVWERSQYIEKRACIEELRFYGHGDYGVQYVAGGQYLEQPVFKMIDNEIDSKNYQRMLGHPMIQDIYCDNAIIKFYGCRSGGRGKGQTFVRNVSNMLNRQVWANTVDTNWGKRYGPWVTSSVNSVPKNLVWEKYPQD